MGREFEVKYRLTTEAKEKILRDFSGFSPISMETTYYDTPEGALGAVRYTLRRRLENGISVCTVKTPAQNGGRGEWETECSDIRQSLPKLVCLGAPEFLLHLDTDCLIPTCGARFTRLAAKVTFADSVLELALDEGILFREDRQCDLLELEAELKSGSEETAVAFGKELAMRYGLVPETDSKFKRARNL